MSMQPKQLDDVLLAFPAKIEAYMPDQGVDPGQDLEDVAQGIFVHGGSCYGFCARDGIDPESACRHLLVVLSSYQFKHERKLRAAGYLIQEWFHTVIRYDDETQDLERSTIVWQDQGEKS